MSLVEQVEAVTEIVRKINETLKDSRINELCKRLDAYGKALNAIINKKHYMFELQFDIVSSEYRVQLFVDGEYIDTVYVPLGTTINALFEKIFTSEEIKAKLTNNIYEVLAELAREVAEKSNLVERVKELERRLVEEDP